MALMSQTVDIACTAVINVDDRYSNGGLYQKKQTSCKYELTLCTENV